MRALLLFLPLLNLCQCAYNWGHQTRELPGGHKTVYVELFKNPTPELGLETVFTDALIKELARSGFAIVTDKNQAELIISGDIIGAGVTASASDPTNFSSRDFVTGQSNNYTASFFTTYSYRVSVNLRALRSRDKQVVWQTSVTGGKSYISSRLKRQGVRSSNVLYNEARKKETVRLIAQDLMSDAFDRMTENF